jgi:hypothetical protein
MWRIIILKIILNSWTETIGLWQLSSNCSITPTKEAQLHIKQNDVYEESARAPTAHVAARSCAAETRVVTLRARDMHRLQQERWVTRDGQIRIIIPWDWWALLADEQKPAWSVAAKQTWNWPRMLVDIHLHVSSYLQRHETLPWVRSLITFAIVTFISSFFSQIT